MSEENTLQRLMYGINGSKLSSYYFKKVRGWKKIFQANGNQKKAGVAILIADKIDFKMMLQKTRKDTT